MISDIRIHKLEEKRLYAKIANYAARDHRLSFGARGMLTYLLSLPPKFVVLKKQIIKEQKATRTSVDNFFAELENFGYLVGADQINSKGEYSHKDYIVYPVPFNQVERIHQDPPIYPEKEVVPMLPNDIGQEQLKTQIFDEKPLKQHEFTDAGFQHLPMSGDSTKAPSTPYNVFKEINNKLNLASQVMLIIEEIKSEYLPNSKKIPLKITSARQNSVALRMKDFNQHWPGRDFIKAIRYAFEYKAKEWAGTDMWKYFTPDTLLSHFIQYLEQAEQNNGTPPAKKPTHGQPQVAAPIYRKEGTDNQHILDELYSQAHQ